MIKKLIKNLLQKKNIYSLDKEKKKSIFDKALKSLTLHHKKNCKDYSLFIKNISNNKKKKIPALHANVFKKKKLISVNDEKIISELNSSGTTGNEKSKIYIDLATAKIQKKVLSRIFNSYVAREKCSIVFICEQPKQGSKKFSAREAGVLGFSTFSKNRFFMVKDEKINFIQLKNFIKQNKENKIIFFGFTNDVYKYLYKKNIVLKKIINKKNFILIHGGGWKKLERLKIDPYNFENKLYKYYGFSKVLNYYGLVEQTGSIFFKCVDCNLFCTSDFSDIDVVDKNLNKLPFKKIGYVLLKSLIPFSYPGHIILTEDLGTIVKDDMCSCGKKGKFFKIFGRAKNSEIRGCGNI